MKSEQKIFLDREENLETVLEYLREARSDRVILNIPKNSGLAAKVDNFRALKQEALELGLELLVESVDDHILELADLAQIQGVNPVFQKRGRAVSDILPRVRYTRPQKRKELENKVQPREEVETEIEEEPEIEEKEAHKEAWREEKTKSKVGMRGSLLTLLIVLMALLSLSYLALYVLPKATISISLEKHSSTFEQTIVVDSEAKEVSTRDENKIILPGELIIAKRNLEMSFPTQNQEKVEAKAQGTLMVYNAYSSEPQVLVADTRFEAPDKKIFRLNKRTTIPGAKIQSGKIIPSKIDVEVHADQAGEEYNINSASAWRIPGFFGTPRYQGFYAESIIPMSGGFIGIKAKPGEEELSRAKAVIRKALEESLKSEQILLTEDRLKLLDKAVLFNILKEEERYNEGENRFSIFAEAEMRYLLFKEAMLKDAIASKTKPPLDIKLEVSNLELGYGEAETDLAQGKMLFQVNGLVSFQPKLDLTSLKAELLNLEENAIKQIIFGVPGLEKAHVSLWPFWVKRVPANSQKVKIILE